MKWWDWMTWSLFLNAEFQASLFTFSFILIKRLFSFSSLSAIRVVISAYPRLLIFLLAILIPACETSSLVFSMRCSAYKLNKQGDSTGKELYSFPNLEQVHCSMSSSPRCFLTCIQISQEIGKVVWYSHLFKNFPQFIAIHTVRDFSIVSEAEVDIFLEFLYFLHDPDVGNLISGSSSCLKSLSYNLEVLDSCTAEANIVKFQNLKSYEACDKTDRCNRTTSSDTEKTTSKNLVYNKNGI